MSSCGVGRHTVDKVNDTDYRCWRCGADEGVMEREEEDAPAEDQPALLPGEQPAVTCAWCAAAPPLDDRIVCSEPCGEAYKQWVIACEVVSGCTRDGQCVRPNGHADDCDWGGDDA